MGRRPLSAHAPSHQRHIVHNSRQRQSIVLSRPDGFAATVMAQSCEARVVSRTQHLIGCVTSCFVHVATVQTRLVLGALYSVITSHVKLNLYIDAFQDSTAQQRKSLLYMLL